MTLIPRERIWVGEDGSFDDASNWDPMQVPTGGDTAVFHNSDISPIEVTFPSEQVSDRVLVTEIVAFLNSTYTLGEGSEVEPALAISPTSASEGWLILDGNRLNCGYASVAKGLESKGETFVIRGGLLNCSRRLTVGESGMGNLIVSDLGQGRVLANELGVAQNAGATGEVTVFDDAMSATSELVAGTTSVGVFGTGTLIVEDAQIETSETAIGEFFGSVGTVELKGEAEESEWTFGGDVYVGKEGTGFLTVSSGTLQSLVDDDLILGGEEGAAGFVSIQGIDSMLSTFGDIFVGYLGDGELSVLEGAQLTTIGSILIDGNDADIGSGTATVEGVVDTGTEFIRSRIEAESLIVGEFAVGRLEVSEGARVDAGNARFGTNTDGLAKIDIGRDGVLSVTGDLYLGQQDPIPGEFAGQALVTLNSGSGIENWAYLVADRIFVSESGNLIQGSGVVQTANGFIDGGAYISTGIRVEDLSKQTTVPRPLTFEGNLTKIGGTIAIGVFDLGANKHGIIEVTGTADIQSATIHFVFQDGFLPKTDDQIPFFMAQGALTVGTLAFTYEGAAPGFQFDVMEEGGMLVFKAMNDAQPEGTEPTPRPTAINPKTDINGDKIIDANDLLEVMRNWYHVVPENN
ncbi:MAG: hypothetical protein KC994_19645 [Candidatus Omnitrophica bacterium]|nr:hypothetical protein [Candidatus Omnitrophota bacterium]